MLYSKSQQQIAANWFPPQERTSATSFLSILLWFIWIGIAALSNLIGKKSACVLLVLGMAASYALSFALIKKGEDFNLLFVIQAGLASVTSIPCLLFFRSKPPTAPVSFYLFSLTNMK